MGGDTLSVWNFSILHDILNVLQATCAVPHMKINNAGFTAQHTSNSCFGEQLLKVFACRLGTAMVRNRYLTSTDYFVYQNNIAANTAGNCWSRYLISTGIDKGRKAFIFKSSCFSQQAFHMAGITIRTKKSNNCSYATAGDLGQKHFRCPRGRATLSATTNKMDMTVYKARNDSFSFQIYYFNIPTCRNFNLILNCCYFFTTQQNILQS